MVKNFKNSLVGNINKRKKAGKSRKKSAGTISREAYREMEAGWPHSKKKRAVKRKQAAKTKRKGAKKKKS